MLFRSVDHDLRKQIQLESMNQYDEELLPAPLIENGLEHDFMLEGGDVWEVAQGKGVYEDYIKNLLR